MAKFCNNCGTMMDDNAVSCPKCGTAAGGGAPAYQPAAPVNVAANQQGYGAPYGAPGQTMQPANRQKPKKQLPVVAIAGGAAALVVVIILLIIFGGGQYSAKAAFKKSFNAQKNLNISKAASVSYAANFDPDKTRSELVKEAKEDLKELKEKYPDEYKEYKDDLKKIKCTDIKVEKLDKDEVEDWKDNLKDLGYKKTDKIKAVSKITYTLKDSDGDEHEDMTSYAIKVGGKWYIYDYSFGF